MINFSLLDEAYPNDDKSLIKKKKKIEEKENCKPLQAPPYLIPSACDNSSNIKKVMDAAMVDNKTKNDYKKDGIRPYDYDEMDAYLEVSDIKTNNTDRTQEYRTTPFLANYLRSLRDNLNKPVGSIETNDKYLNIEQFSNMNNLKVDVNLYNLFLFIFLGIIIIILIDQITKLVLLKKT